MNDLKGSGRPIMISLYERENRPIIAISITHNKNNSYLITLAK